MKKVIPASAVLIPGDAVRVFQGVIFDVYQWQQQRFDGSMATFEMLRRPDTVQAMVVRGSLILLIEDTQPGRQPRLHLPGGRVDETDESWDAAIRRELREETGLVCHDWRLVDAVQVESKFEWFGALYLATGISDELEPDVDPGGEIIRPVWREYAVVRDEVLHGKTASMRYLTQFFARVGTIDELLALPEFEGQMVDR